MAKPTDDEEWTQLAIRIPKSLHRELKLHCVQSDVSLMKFTITAIRESLAKGATGKRTARA